MCRSPQGLQTSALRPLPQRCRRDIAYDLFSLGQDDSYYENLNNFGDKARDRFLRAMRDVAKDGELFERTLSEDVTGVSLLRFVSVETVRGQFRRMANGGARLTSFNFSYTPPARPGLKAPTYSFDVEPNTRPPTNVHVLIGRNGVGKTYTVNQMATALVRPNAKKYGTFAWKEDDFSPSQSFSNIVSVSFSAFDPFEPPPNPENKLNAVRYQYIGLKHTGVGANGKPLPPKSPTRLAADFARSVEIILNQVAKCRRWIRVLDLLESDRIFKRADVKRLVEQHRELLREKVDRAEALTEFRQGARDLFSKLSSGHKIVLLTITRLVEMLEERSLVLVDEPEAHLHPPLLSAFIRTLSELLMDRNGVAIIATHSPVILQEVPRTCVWRIRRAGAQTKIERPARETFGENVGSLTQSPSRNS